MMEVQESINARNGCLKNCEAEFIRYTARKPVGGSEVLRVCRDACPQDAEKEKQPLE